MKLFDYNVVNINGPEGFSTLNVKKYHLIKIIFAARSGCDEDGIINSSRSNLSAGTTKKFLEASARKR